MSGKGARVGKGLGKKLQGMLWPIVVIQKKDRFELGYKPDRQERQRFVEEKREKRIASFLGKEKENGKMEIPPLSHTFRSTGFINLGAVWSKVEEMLTEVDKAFESLSIDMVEVGDQKASNTRLPPFTRG